MFIDALFYHTTPLKAFPEKAWKSLKIHLKLPRNNPGISGLSLLFIVIKKTVLR